LREAPHPCHPCNGFCVFKTKLYINNSVKVTNSKAEHMLRILRISLVCGAEGAISFPVPVLAIKTGGVMLPSPYGF